MRRPPRPLEKKIVPFKTDDNQGVGTNQDSHALEVTVSVTDKSSKGPESHDNGVNHVDWSAETSNKQI